MTLMSQSTCLSVNIYNGLSFFAESFNYWDINEKSTELSYDSGLVYSFKKYQLDVSYIANHNDNKVHYGTLMIGFSAKL